MDFSQGYVVAWALMALLMGLLSLLLMVIVYRVLRNRITLKMLDRAVGKGDFFPKVEIQKEGSLLLINLALVNSSDDDVWTEHCVISLSDFKGIPSHGFEATFKSMLLIREYAAARDVLRIGLCRTVYEAAGRPQQEYSFMISGTVQYRLRDAWHHQPFPLRRVKMWGLQPIEVRAVPRSPANSNGGEPRLLVLSQD